MILKEEQKANVGVSQSPCFCGSLDEGCRNSPPSCSCAVAAPFPDSLSDGAARLGMARVGGAVRSLACKFGACSSLTLDAVKFYVFLWKITCIG